MEKIFIFLATATFTSGIQYDALKVKFGWSDALADKEYFFTIPRTMSQAENEGWCRTERPPGPMKELRMYCPPGRAVCPLFDTAGFVAGLQIAFPVDGFESIIKPEKKLVKWQAPAIDGEPAREYWTATQFYVSEESLKAGAGPQMENGATLQDGGVWVTGPDGQQLRIPSTEAELNTTTFKKQNCIPNMGKHYYYNMTPELNCEDLFPWFALTTGTDLVGTGFQIIGKVPKPLSERDWFERPPSAGLGVAIAIPFAPKCLGEWASKYGVLSLHIYFVKEPWNIRCSPGDSAKPAPPLDRLSLTWHRYMTKLTDELKNIIT